MTNPQITKKVVQLQKIDKNANRITQIFPIVSVDSIISDGESITEILAKKAPLESPNFTGTPTTPTANGNNENEIANVKYVTESIERRLSTSDVMIFKGTIGTGGTITTLPNSHSVGDTYKVITNGKYAGKQCEIGDMIICIKDGTAAKDNDWTIVQSNLDGAVIGPNSSTSKNVAIFNSATGKVIADSGYTIETSVPPNAVFTDTTYQPATSETNGLLTSLDKQKLDTVTEGAQPNLIDSISVNGQTQSIVNKNVDIAVPTDYLTKATKDLENYYLKTETMTTTQINEALNALNSISIKKVTQLPTPEQAKKNVIYLVPKDTSTADNIYLEYIWCEQEDGSYDFELIGDTAIDMENTFVSVEKIQHFTEIQQRQARENIGAGGKEIIVSDTPPTDHSPIWINLSANAPVNVAYQAVIENNNTDTNVVQELIDYHEFRYKKTLTQLKIKVPQIAQDRFYTNFVFKSGSSATKIQIQLLGNTQLYFIGADCKNHVFTPVANHTYNIIIWYDGFSLVAEVKKI